MDFAKRIPEDETLFCAHVTYFALLTVYQNDYIVAYKKKFTCCSTDGGKWTTTQENVYSIIL